MTKVSVKKHLKELQWRLMIVAFFFIAGACLAYNYQAQLIPLLLDPLHGEKLVYLNPAGGFSFIFLISIYAGMALGLPVLMQQIYSFLKPALPEAARRKSTVIIISSFALMIGGVAFGYFVAVPNALNFLYGFADAYVTASLTAESYLNFVIAYTIGIGIVFQIPLLLLLIHTIKPLTPGGLLKSERWVIVGSFIIAAIITPTPDPINQAIIAVPVIVVYQLGVVAILFSIAKQRRIQKRANKRAPLSTQHFEGLLVQPDIDEGLLVLTPVNQVLENNTPEVEQPAVQQPIPVAEVAVVAPVTEPVITTTPITPDPILFNNRNAHPGRISDFRQPNQVRPPTRSNPTLQTALEAEIQTNLESTAPSTFDLELQAALDAEIPEMIAPAAQATQARTAPTARPSMDFIRPTNTTIKSPNMTRPAFRSMDGIIRQPNVKPHSPSY